MDKKIESIIVGGGCFWCTESLFKNVKGVLSTECGYAGGMSETQPNYKEVCTGLTGYAEVVKIDFDPNIITLSEVLIIFMATHDPTSLNKQGGDEGTQYRSVIFYESEMQKNVAHEVINELQPHYPKPIVTEITTLSNYHRAEEYHQDYYTKNPDQAYCNAVIPPKLEKLKKLFANKLK